MRLGCDLDGVLASFEHGFLPVLNLAGAGLSRDLLDDPAFPECWDWPAHHKVSGMVLEKAWKLVWSAPYFWQNLPELQGRKTIEAIRDLNDARRRGHDVYFITHRSGKHAKFQSEEWLRARGFNNPTVLIAGDKGRAAALLDLDFYVDDRTENCNAVAYRVKACQTFVFDRPYNQACALPRTANLQETLTHVLSAGCSDTGSHHLAGAAIAGAESESNHHRYRV